MQDRKVAYVLTFIYDKCDVDILFLFDNVVPLRMQENTSHATGAWPASLGAGFTL